MEGQAALVTGGSSGIGLAAARLLLEAGARVMVVGRDLDRLKAAAESLPDHDGRLKIMPGDVSREGSANKLVGEAVKAFGGLTMLVNAAGVFRGGSLIDMSEEDFDYILDINLKGTWFVSKFACRPMRESGGGAIVNVSSLLAHRAWQGTPSTAYSASKGGVISLTRALAVELAPMKIRVNCVVPALIDTPMVGKLSDDRDKMLEKAARAYPAGRIGKPEDVARAIMYLLDPANDWITGTELMVDGGRACL